MIEVEIAQSIIIKHFVTIVINANARCALYVMKSVIYLVLLYPRKTTLLFLQQEKTFLIE